MTDAHTATPDLDHEAALGSAIRAHLRHACVGSLCTLAAHRGLEGFPFGSVVPYALTAEGKPILLLASIAAHTANLRRDPRATMLVRNELATGDPQAGWRVAVLATWARWVSPGAARRTTDLEVSPGVLDEAWARYIERLPSAAEYPQTHDFELWVPRDLVRVRYIGGFGSIHWLPGGAVLSPPLPDTVAAGAVSHLDEDHTDALITMCEGIAGFRPATVRTLGIDTHGLLVRASEPDRTVFFRFDEPAQPANLRQRVVELVARARRAVAP